MMGKSSKNIEKIGRNHGKTSENRGKTCQNRGHDDYIGRSLQKLRRGGTFVELGKRGVWSPQEVHERRPDVRRTAVLRGFSSIFGRFSSIFVDFRPFSAVSRPFE